MKNDEKLIRINSISEVHQIFGLPKPQHPLISVMNFTLGNSPDLTKLPAYDVLNFYKVTFITKLSGQLRYGQGHYDYDEGSMLFVAPNQLVGSGNYAENSEGYILLIHPDFFLGYPLAPKVKQYGYFSYTANEALHLSDSEREIILSVYQIIEKELRGRIDEFSQDIVIAQIELLLSYANRFYRRQFITRKSVNHDVLQRVETILDEYFEKGQPLHQGIPTVQFLSEHLHISPGYLSDLLRSLIGQNAQQYIRYKLIEKAKEKLSTTQLNVSEIAYELGFEHSQSFSKLFKSKTNLSPLEFRATFN
ncbi:helix-turn-helix domain-containing protein [Siphonobacter sp.]|uniref:helix-turn-helix domain-containing protein n=1 Tax=Siphonobacter sp. TaxID=1869184 RepID=UPI003B3AF996